MLPYHEHARTLCSQLHQRLECSQTEVSANAESSQTEAADKADACTYKKRKGSRDARFERRKDVQDMFLSLSPDEALQYLANKEKQWKTRKGADWQWYEGQWWLKEWEYKERWVGPY